MMVEKELHTHLVLALFGLAAITFVALLLLTAPYGRHARKGWGPSVPNRLGWVLMECPAVLGFAGVYFAGTHRFALTPLVLLAVWQCHYVNRTFIFPFRLRTSGKRMPLMVMCMGMLFNCLNAYVNARWISELGSYANDWLADPRFICGVALFVGGWLLNTRSDKILLELRKPGEKGYRIPHAGPYRWISCPNYLGEILEWAGWALATYSLAGLAFAIYTIANLAPRAIAHHRWYRERFEDYPKERKALIPFVL